jgi:hypothetical protein
MLPTSVLLPELWGQVRPSIKAHEKAVFLLMNLVNCPSPARERLSRCDSCGEYFIRRRAPKRETPIYHGSFCANCKGKGGVRRTDMTRKSRTKKKVELAADVWPKWKQDRRQGERTEWVAQEVNRRLRASRDPIAKNWVTRHQTEIEAEVERRNHAKG